MNIAAALELSKKASVPLVRYTNPPTRLMATAAGKVFIWDYETETWRGPGTLIDVDTGSVLADDLEMEVWELDDSLQ